MKKICIITGTRAEYGLLRWLMQGVINSKKLDLQIIVTGMHLSPEFGLTINNIINDGFKVDKKVEMLISADTSTSISKSMGIGLIGFADALEDLKPDLVLVLGDRFEIFSAVSASMVALIPIGHIHGGESTEGVIDESIRHSISKMSHLHFVATKTYQNRVIQLGENPSNVFLVGGLGIDNIKKIKLLNKTDLASALNFKLGEKNFLVTFHPVTLEKYASDIQVKELLSALETIKDTKFIFTMPNADTEGRGIYNHIKKFVDKNSNSKIFKSLGQKRYLSCIKHFDGVIGNSSSGLIEVPSFKKGTINIGDRQKGRIKAQSVINCKPEKSSILKSIEKLNSSDFQRTLKKVSNPYGNGGASEKILEILENISFENLLKKKFNDLL